MKNGIQIAIILGLGGAGTAFYFHRKKEKQNQKATDILVHIKRAIRPATQGIISVDAFDIHYADKIKNSKGDKSLLQDGEAKQYAEDLYESFNWWNDDEDTIYSVFQSVKNKAQVSQIAKAFFKTYRVNLIYHLNKLDQDELEHVLAIVKRLKPY